MTIMQNTEYLFISYISPDHFTKIIKDFLYP